MAEWNRKDVLDNGVNILYESRGFPMHLYEIKAASFAKKVAEEFSANIDDDLDKVASDIGKAGSEPGEPAADPMAGNPAAAPDPMAGESPLQAADDAVEPDPEMGTEMSDEEQDEMLMQKVDAALVDVAKGHPYVKSYKHPDNSKIHPYKILTMQMDELQQLRTMARNKANMEGFNDEPGVYTNPDIKFFQDLVSFVDHVIETMKSVTKPANDKKQGKNAKFDQKADPKTKPGKAKQPKVK